MAPNFVHYVVLEIPNITPNTSFAGVFRTFSGLELSFDVLEYLEGGNNETVCRLPGRMRYPNLVLEWGMVDDEMLLKWFAQTRAGAQLQEITLTLAATQGNVSTEIRKFSFTDAFPVHWAGPALAGDGAAGDWGERLEIAHSGLKLDA